MTVGNMMMDISTMSFRFCGSAKSMEYLYSWILIRILYLVSPEGADRSQWSRFSGGSGAPLWTLVAAGLNPQNFHATEGAILHSHWPDPAKFPFMLWSSNYVPTTQYFLADGSIDWSVIPSLPSFSLVAISRPEQS